MHAGRLAPFIGDYRPEDDFYTNSGIPGVVPANTNGTTLNAFLATEVRKGDINGTWTLETVDTNTSVPSPPNFINFWTLNLSTGLTPDPDAVVVGGPTLLNVWPGGSGFGFGCLPHRRAVVARRHRPRASPWSRTTRWAHSAPMRAGFYMAFVGYYDVTIDGVKNPTTNTDIFLTYSDDAGRTWSNPVQVNDDTAASMVTQRETPLVRTTLTS